MEDTLRENIIRLPAPETVLILVVMEDTLRESSNNIKTINYEVLILVVMEDTLRELNYNIIENHLLRS